MALKWRSNGFEMALKWLYQIDISHMTDFRVLKKLAER